MIEFLIVFVTLLTGVFLFGAVMFLAALSLAYAHKLFKLVLSDNWSMVATLAVAVVIVTFFFSLGIYFGEEPL